MSLPEFIDEPILVQARLLPDGAMQPTAFVWRGRTYLIADCGRQWQEDAGGITWNCYTERKSVECIHTEAGICQPSGTNSKLVVSREASSSRY